MRHPLILLAILGLPLAEIAAFVAVGSRIGVLATIGLVLATSALGLVLLRAQGLGTLRRIRAVAEAGDVPDRELVHGLMILLAGLLLIPPGFLTDIAGLLLFVPFLRELGWRLVRGHILVVAPVGRPARAGGPGRVVDLDESEYSRRADEEDAERRRLEG